MHENKSNCNESPKKKRRKWLIFFLLFLLVVGGMGYWRHAGGSFKSILRMLSFGRKFDVVLTIREPSGIDRTSEPVTSGVPLPEHKVFDTSDLFLIDKVSESVIPCQFTVLSRWPGEENMPDDERSIKWVLLDFFADVKAGQQTEYTLANYVPNKLKGVLSGLSPQQSLRVRENDVAIMLDTGPLQIKFSKTRGTIIEDATIDGRKIISAEHPAEVVLKRHDEKDYYTSLSKPYLVEVEDNGPLRACVRLKGTFRAKSGKEIFDSDESGGKVGYDLRITAYAGKPYVKIAFTLENNGWYGYRNERHKQEWLYMKSLNINVPIVTSSTDNPEAVMTGKRFVVSPGSEVAITQWYKFPYEDVRGQKGILTKFGTTNVAQHTIVGGMAGKHRGFYSAWTTNGEMTRGPERVDGAVGLQFSSDTTLRMVNRHFRENHPRGFAITRSREQDSPTVLTFQMLPKGGWWPESVKAFKARTYQFEGGRYKTAVLFLGLDVSTSVTNETKMLDQPLMATAPTSWYRDTGAVYPLADPANMHTNLNPEVVESFEQYDRMQRAKVILEAGDPAGPGTFGRDNFGRVSIPSLYERYPEVFTGWMNFGDLVWTYGYCSLFYDWPYSMLTQYLRLGDREFLDVGENMARHRYDIDQYHVMNTKTYLGGFQRYEKGEHGHLLRQKANSGKKASKFEINAAPSHTWNRGLLLHWALTGDRRSLDAAEQNGRAFYRYFYDQRKLLEKDLMTCREFRTPGRAMKNWLALYEYTGKSEYLDWARDVFKRTLLAMEQENGGKGHILPKGHQSPQFLAYIIEPVCLLHHYTGSSDAIEFLRRCLDWQREEGCIWGVRKDGFYYPVRWRKHWDSSPDPELGAKLELGYSLYYSLHFSDGYAYLYSVLGRKKDMEFSRQLFRDVVFYYSFLKVKGEERSPVGYHFGGRIVGWTPKFQAFTGRHGNFYLQTEAEF